MKPALCYLFSLWGKYKHHVIIYFRSRKIHTSYKIMCGLHCGMREISKERLYHYFCFILFQLWYDTTLCDKVCQCLATGRGFTPFTRVSSTNETDRHDIGEILLTVALNTIILTNYDIYLTEKFKKEFRSACKLCGLASRHSRRDTITGSV